MRLYIKILWNSSVIVFFRLPHMWHLFFKDCPSNPYMCMDTYSDHFSVSSLRGIKKCTSNFNTSSIVTTDYLYYISFGSLYYCLHPCKIEGMVILLTCRFDSLNLSYLLGAHCRRSSKFTMLFSIKPRTKECWIIFGMKIHWIDALFIAAVVIPVALGFPNIPDETGNEISVACPPLVKGRGHCWVHGPCGPKELLSSFGSLH